MKYFFLTVISFAVIVSGCVMLNGSRINAKDGIYEGTGRGYRGPISVQVVVSGGYITEIEILDSIEDQFIGGQAIEELLELIIFYNTTDLDVISGATESSRGFLEAVENSLR
jgi:uncharacterized protein with FMN-binding domain